ncbi:MAG: selenocysteine-specific translation elongation factor [Candidatus Latescibacterota bacterium]|nr:selenocysteine-specific translation elongation factor [Candidatus Latescibacterota bacterium]
MPHIVIGTAGHIDHGKTLLVKALTGTDTDRAPEEKARGITIELGFAVFGDDATIIDVPGHERFVKTMVAGVSTIDLAMLVIAADDGVMPQTREHLDVLELMGVPRGLVVLNKVDLADEEWQELVREDIAELTAGTVLEDAPVMAVSALTGEGIEELRQFLFQAVAESQRRRSQSRPFRLPVDRFFTVKGYGRVCTGTVLSGRLRAGDAVEVLPAAATGRVRGLQIHGVDVEVVTAGDRAALNLHGLDDEPSRGDVIASPGSFRTTNMIDARLRLLPSAPRALEQRTRIRFHLGTGEVLARVVLLESDTLAPGQDGLVQLRLERPVVAAWGDRFVIRRYSPALTIGGGIVLDVSPAKHRGVDDSAARRLVPCEADSADAVVGPRIAAAHRAGIVADDLEQDLGIHREEMDGVLNKLTGDGLRIVKRGGCRRLFDGPVWKEVSEAVLAKLSAYHRSHPLEAGMPRAELEAATTQRRAEELFRSVLEELEKEGAIAADGARLRTAAHRIKLGAEEEDLGRRILQTLNSTTFDAMPDAEALAGDLCERSDRVLKLLRALERLDRIIFLDEKLFLSAERVAAVQQELSSHLESHGEITVSRFRGLIGGTRRYALGLLNHFDAEGVTERNGDVRTLRR